VGKAINLKNRVNSYFAKGRDLPVKIQQMVELIDDIQIVTVDSEVEAFILETNLIKKYRPKYNRMMKDDKMYVWVMFDDSKDFPRPEIVREKLKKNATYFGPYPQKFPASKVLRRLRRLFPYCSINFPVKEVDGKLVGTLKRPCLDYHIGVCSGVCAGLITREQHRKNINNIKRFFRGQKYEIYDELKQKMDQLSAEHKYEEAARIRDSLNDLKYVTQRITVDTGVDEEVLLQKKKSFNQMAVKDLFERIGYASVIESKNLAEVRIECYDISNIQGKNAVGSMVVNIGGSASKENYRKFKIKTKETPDDFSMMKEVLTRRFTHSIKKKANVGNKDSSFEWLPDLVIVDGGKGQLSSARDIFCSIGILDQVKLVGLAKKQEEIFKIVETNDGEKDFKKIVLPRRSNSLYLVQRIRDEAHRFAIGYHRKLRSKASTKSVLDDIPGVGEIVKHRLLNAFGSLQGIKKASKKDLQTVVRNRRTVEAILKLRDVEL